MGFFHVRESGWIDETVVFDYYDPDHYYASLTRDELLEEKEALARNMQFYLDLEDVRLNGKPCFPRVLDVDVGFRGSMDHPYVVFTIVFKGELVEGVNVFEDRYEEEVAEYGYRVYWILPPTGRFTEVDVGVPYMLSANNRILVFTVDAGVRVRGYERIVFEIEKRIN
ncbi:hypothetical protein Desmu_0926 [Desulfurococcus mucosus DSM 2162]|uniref:Uncharacterized protein n=1 Tax=Desulfurococcus mucosus (strain ATCC 35584 / DSM 2162 / JCM 9187 / O7/1) TaxID=765177 RepID=E8R9Q3_DESM0|nr:hypothetical protein Desmu_0926 [Desulfurococcus mucosus DSM 2162]